MSDSPVNAPKKQFKCLDLDIEQMKAEHRDQIVGEARKINFGSFIDIIACHIIVWKEVDSKGALEEW